MEEQPDFEAAYTMDAQVMEQVDAPHSRMFIAGVLQLPVSHCRARAHQVLRSFVSAIGMENEYTIIVINPRLPARHVTYGYRFGFSQSELNHLRSSKSVVPELLSRPSRDVYSSSLKSARGAPDASNLASVSERSEAWSRRFLSSMYGSSSIDVQDALHSAIPEKMEEWFAWHKVHAGTADRVTIFSRLASNMLQSSSPVDRAYIHSHIIEAAGSAGCLSEAWVGAHRFAWIDMTAGQFTWGTGTGAKGVDSFPHVAPDFLSRAPSQSAATESSVNRPITHFFLPMFMLLLSLMSAQLNQEQKIVEVVMDSRCGSDERVRHAASILQKIILFPSFGLFPTSRQFRCRGTILKHARKCAS